MSKPCKALFLTHNRLFFSNSILIQIFCEAVVFCASQGKQCDVNILNHNPDRKGNMHHLCPGKVKKWFSSVYANRLFGSAGCSLVRPALSRILDGCCLHSSSYSERLRFILLGRRPCQNQNCQMLVTSLDEQKPLAENLWSPDHGGFLPVEFRSVSVSKTEKAAFSIQD